MDVQAGLSAAELVQLCNKILVYSGLIARVSTVEEVKVICSSTSVFVAALEGFLQHRLRDIIRAPKSPAENAFNIILVVEKLSELLHCDLSHISGLRCVEGALEDLGNLLELLATLCQGKALLGPPSPSKAAVCPDVFDAHKPRQLGQPLIPTQPESNSISYNTGADRERSSKSARHLHSGEKAPGHQAIAIRRELHPACQEDSSRPNEPPVTQQQARTDAAAVRAASLDAPDHALQGVASPSGRRRAGAGATLSSRRRIRLGRSGMRRSRLLLLSPIPEVSVEYREEDSLPSVQNGGVDNLSQPNQRTAYSAPAREAQGHQPVLWGNTSHVPLETVRSALPYGPRGSAGGTSSAISIPSVAARSSASEAMARGSGVLTHDNVTNMPARSAANHIALEQDAVPASRVSIDVPPASGLWPRDRTAWSEASSGSYGRSESITTLLQRAVGYADPSLQGLKGSYVDHFYSDGGTDDESDDRITQHDYQNHMRRSHQERVASGGSAGTSELRENLGDTRGLSHRPSRGGAQSGNTGTVKQYHAFLQRAAGLLVGETGTGSSEAELGSSGMRSVSSTDASGRPRSMFMPRSTQGPKGGRRKAREKKGKSAMGPNHAARMRPLRRVEGARPRQPCSQPWSQPTLENGRTLLQRTSAAYGAALPAAPDGGNLDSLYEALLSTGADPKGRLHLSGDLAAKLRYVYGLALEHPKRAAARAAVERQAVSYEQQRHVERRRMVERLSGARARREAALRLGADRMREQAQEHAKRVEQLRLQRLTSEWKSRQRGAHMRGALQAELALREAFMEVVRAEKEALLEEQRAARESAAARLPRFKNAMRHAERQYLDMYDTLQGALASERKQRVRAAREATLAAKQSHALAAGLVQERLRELLGRVAAGEEALLQRGSVAHRPQSRQALVAQIRRLIGLS